MKVGYQCLNASRIKLLAHLLQRNDVTEDESSIIQRPSPLNVTGRSVLSAARKSQEDADVQALVGS